MTQTDFSEPTRLLEDPSLDPSLRHDLEIASQEPALAYSPAQLDHGLSRLELGIATSAVAPPASGRSLGWFAGALAVLGGSALAVSLLWPRASPEDQPGRQAQNQNQAQNKLQTSDDPHPATASRGEAAVAAASPAPPQPESDTADDAPAVDDVDPAGAVGHHGGGALDSPTVQKPGAKAPKAGPKQPDPPLSAASEALQLNEARKALATNPARTLELTTAGERDFPKGAMIQERRGYAILALVALDRRSEAESRAAPYLERWPKGALSRRIREALDL